METARPRIWVLDDVASDAARVRSALSADYDVEVFSDGLALIERLGQDRPPDGFVVDWVMPAMNGPEVCGYLRQQPQGARWAVLLLTAQNHTDQIVEGLAAGADDYVAKPFVEAELRARVHAVVRAKRMVERANMAEQAVAALLERSPDAFLAVSESDHITYANDKAAQLFGCARQALIGKPASLFLPDVAWREQTPLQDIQLGGKVYSPQLWKDLPGTGDGMAISLRDVTEQRSLVARRLDFYSIIAHDLRQPLNASMLRLQMLQQNAFGPISPPIAESVARIENNLSFLVTLINDFLDLANLENTDFRMDSKLLNLEALAHEVADELSPLGHARQVRLRVQIENTRHVQGDMRRLRQALSNLVSNAIRFSPVAAEVLVRTRDESCCVRIEVVDQGPGVEEALRERLFQRYTRASEHIPSQQSTGLGLMIVREVAVAHGGSVGFESEIGRGSRFWIDLPSRESPSGWEMQALSV